MSLRFAHILSSGSPAEVTSITASNLPDIIGSGVGNAKHSLLFTDSNGQFYSSSKIHYTEQKNHLVFEGVDVVTHNLTASGIPDTLLQGSSIIFINQEGGLETTSSLFYNVANNAVVFDGVFSGSFTGDGSGLTGVVANTANPLTNGLGIGSASANPSDLQFNFDGSQQITLQVLTASNGGIGFGNAGTGVQGLKLEDSLPGLGLEWNTPNSILQINLSGSSNGTSGLKLVSDGLAISDNIDGDGLDLTSGVLSIDLAAESGLVFDSSKLRINSSLAGDGLRFSSSFDILEINPNEVVTSSAEITFKTGSNNLTLNVTSNGVVTPVAQGFSAKLIDQPQITYDVSDNLTGNLTINGNLEVDANTVISGSSLTVVADTFIKDPFPLINSGSQNSQGGFVVRTGTSTGAFLIYNDITNAWAVSNSTISQTTQNHNIIGDNYAILASTRLINDTTANIVGATPLFGTTTPTRVGQMIVQKTPDTNESPLFIYA